MESVKQNLYVVVSVADYQCDIHRIEDHQQSLGEPVFKIRKPMFPDFMNFAAVGSRIFMVGGDVGGVASNKVFAFNTVTSSLESVPPLNSGKSFPYLITLGSKLFALSYQLNHFGLVKKLVNGTPRFEVLDTEELDSGWSALPMAPLDASKACYGEFSYAAVTSDKSSGFIFASVGDSGTWVFDVDGKKWSHVSNDPLPFSGYAMARPNVKSVCCAYSLKSEKFCSFRFHYDPNKSRRDFVIDEIEIDDSDTFPPLNPSLACCQSTPPVICSDGRVYFVGGGVDKVDTYNSLAGNQYVEVYTFRLNQLDAIVGSSKRPLLRRCKDKRRSKKQKRQMTIEKAKEEGDEDKDEDDVEVENLKLTCMWSKSFFGGPAFDSHMHIEAAFVI